MTQAEYESKLTEYADSLGLRGVITDSVIKLLAYSMNLKNSELNEKILNTSFPSATNLNNRIAHAASLLYSVYRGTNPTVSMYNIIANRDNSYRYLDDAFQYNGIYYFYNQNIDTIQGNIYNVDYIVSDKPRQSVTQSVGSLEYHYIDFNYANMSESIRLIKDNETLATWTSDPYEYMSSNVDEIEYLVITIPNYGVRVLKRYNQDWDCITLTLDYLNYYEIAQDITNLRSIGDFTYDLDTSDSSSIPYTPRLESGEAIYMDATKTFMSRNQIGSITDVECLIEGTYDPLYGDYVSVYNIVQSDNKYNVYIKSSTTIQSNIQSEINKRNPPYPFIVSGMNPKDNQIIRVKCKLTNPSVTIEELNGYFNPLWQTYRSLTINQMVTQILRYDIKLTSCELEVIGGSGLIESDPKANEYYDILLEL